MEHLRSSSGIVNALPDVDWEKEMHLTTYQKVIYYNYGKFNEYRILFLGDYND